MIPIRLFPLSARNVIISNLPISPVTMLALHPLRLTKFPRKYAVVALTFLGGWGLTFFIMLKKDYICSYEY